jgi:hypothetical protein
MAAVAREGMSLKPGRTTFSFVEPAPPRASGLSNEFVGGMSAVADLDDALKATGSA